MIAYLDASVLLRVLLQQKDQLQCWSEISFAVTSALSRVECLRTLDRLLHDRRLQGDAVLALRTSTYRLFESLEVVEIFPEVLERASNPLPKPLATLDAIHLSTALLWRAHRTEELTLATHDRALARAGQSMGLRVEGI